MKEHFSIKDYVIIITGGAGDIGSKIAQTMVEQSAHVFAFDKKTKKSRKNLEFIKCDLTKQSEFKKHIQLIGKKYAKIDVLINAAGITIPSSSEKYSFDDWIKTISINLSAAFTCSQIVFPFLRKSKNPSIINITSINAKLAFPNNPAYVASKGGLSMLGKSLARDWGKFGIRVNNLAPGYIKAGMTMQSYKNKKLRKNRANRTMLGYWGEIKDLVGPCIFLASNASRYITGQDIYVDGGWISNGLSDE